MDVETAAASAPLTVVIVKVAVVAPAETVTLAGTEATVGLLLKRFTLVPPASAAILSVTVPVTRLPPTTGFTLKARVVGTGANVTVAVSDLVGSATLVA